MQGKLRNVAASIVKRAAASYDDLRSQAPGVVVLAYHRIGGGSTRESDLDVDVFNQQMMWLAEHRTVVSLDAAVELLANGGDPPTGNPVVVTFDDGTADFADHALPVIAECQVPVTYYIATDYIEQQRRFPDEGVPLSWAALDEARSTGLVTVGSHTHSHAVIDKLSAAETEQEMRRSRELIEDRLEVSAKHFAYPKGVFGGTERERFVGQYFSSAALVGGGVNPYRRTPLLRLRRNPIQRSDGMHYFRLKANGGMRLEGDLRELLNKARYRRRAN